MQVLVPDTSSMKDNFKATATSAEQQRNKIANDIQEILKNVQANSIKGEECLQDNTNNATVEESLGESSCLYSAPAGPACPTIPGISQLLPHLFLCGAGAVTPPTLDQLNISFIVNIAPELPDISRICKPLYLRIDLMDRPDANISAHFDEVADMIEGVHRMGGNTLVHCVAGVSRSASLCLAYLMKYADMSLRQAYEHVKQIRPQIRPNTGFFQQLRCYEEQLRGCQSIHMVFYESLNREIPDVYEPEYKAMEEFYQRRRNALKQR